MTKAKRNRATATLHKTGSIQHSNGNGHNGDNKPLMARKDKDEIKSVLLDTDPTRDYQNSRFSYYGELFVQQIPQWRLWTGRMMMSSDPLVKFMLNTRNAALASGEIKVKAKNPKLKKWVEDQWNFLWNHHALKLMAAKKWGYAPLQVIWKMEKDGLIHIKSLKDFQPEDCRALVVRNRLVGLRVQNSKLFFPQALWIKFDAECGSPYGTGCLRRAYPAWYEKWMDHGAKRLLQLRMIKDSYIGDIFWYPPNMLIEIPKGGGTSIKLSYRDLMRELGENRLSGGALTMPMIYDNNGKELTKYTPPQDVGYGSQIFDWNDKCDEGILQGGDIPIEVVKAQESGSGYSGRSVPMLSFLSTCTQEFKDMVDCVNEQVLRPGAWLNFGGEPEYELEVVSLVKSFSDDTQGSPMGGSAIGGPASRAQQQEQQELPPDSSGRGVQYGEEGEHKFSSTQFNLPPELSSVLRQLGERIDHQDLQPTDYGDLSDTGLELNSHVTVLYGLHTDNGEELRSIVSGLGPIAIQLGEVSVFNADMSTPATTDKPKYDVLKVEVISKGLHELHQALKDNFEHTSTYPDYKPHVTIAYVKPGMGSYYAEKFNLLKGQATTFNRLIFSDKNRNHLSLPLCGQASFQEGGIPSNGVNFQDIEQFTESDTIVKLRQLITKGMVAKAKLVQERIEALGQATLDLPTLAGLIEREIKALAPILTPDLASIGLYTKARGVLDVVDRLADERSDLPTHIIPPGRPLQAPATAPDIKSVLGGEVGLPQLDDVLERLERSPIARGSNYLETAAKVREGAFAITTELTDKAVIDVKDLLSTAIKEGHTKEDFISAVNTKLGSDKFSDAHLENVIRTNQASLYSDARMEALGHNLVADAFPYVGYSATHDARVRPDHVALERLGLDGTNMYRAQDPTFKKFRPPWSFQCRCSWYPVSVEQAARAGVSEAKDWWEKAQAMAKEKGGSAYQYLVIVKPSNPQFVTPPPFEPSPGFSRGTI